MRMLLPALATVLFASAALAGDYVVRDGAGRRVEIVEQGAPGGASLRRDLQGRRLGVMEPAPGGYVLRDERGRRVGAVQTDRGFAVPPRGDAGVDRRFDRFQSGVVRDRAGRRVGTIMRR